MRDLGGGGLEDKEMLKMIISVFSQVRHRASMSTMPLKMIIVTVSREGHAASSHPPASLHDEALWGKAFAATVNF